MLLEGDSYIYIYRNGINKIGLCLGEPYDWECFVHDSNDFASDLNEFSDVARLHLTLFADLQSFTKPEKPEPARTKSLS